MYITVGSRFHIHVVMSIPVSMLKWGRKLKIQMSTDYAIRMIKYIQEQGDRLLTGSEIAEAIDVPYPFVARIASQLKRNGILSAVKGRRGGYTLAKPINQINFYEVFVSIEGELQVSRCIKDNHDCCRGSEDSCGLKGFLFELQDSMIKEMSNKNIFDIYSRRGEESI